MPDFDKDLNPFLLNTNKNLPTLPNPSNAAPDNYQPIGGGSYGDLSGRGLDPIFGKSAKGPGLLPTVSARALYENRRYDIYSADIIDIENQKANAQSRATQAVNGTLKGLNLAATTIAGGFGMLYGAVKSPFTGRLADIWDNEVMQGLDKWNNEVDQNYLPNYYSNQEKNAKWYSTDNWLTTNFLFDKLIKNSGFAVGAMVSGNIANGVLGAVGALAGEGALVLAGASEASQAFKIFTPLLKNTARAFSQAKNIEVANILEKELSSIADVTARTSKIAELAKATNKFAGITDYSRRTAIAAYSSAGEASFEALQTSNEYRNNLIEEYKKTYGEAPTGVALKNINEESDKVGKTSFLGNMALLTLTEFKQLPYLTGSSYSASKRAANNLAGKIEDVILKDGKYVSAISEPVSVLGKAVKTAKRIGTYVFDPKEAGQEIGQYALQIGTQNYFEKSKQSNDASILTDGFLYGMFGEDEKGKAVGALVSKEGIEGGILGGITGGLMQVKSNIQEAKQTKTNTEAFINSINNAPTFKQAFQERLDSANRGIVLQQQQQDAVIKGDKLNAKDLDFDMLHNYLAPRIKYGRMDMIMDDFAELKAMGQSNEGLSSLAEQGLANINDNIQSFQNRINTLEATAKNIDELYASTNLRFSGEILKDENGKELVDENGFKIKKYSPLVIDKIVYAASKVTDYDLRIPELSARLVRANIPVQEVVDDELLNDTSVSLAKVIYNIDQQKSSRIDTELVKQELKDVVDLSKRRQQFITEYHDLIDNPQNYMPNGDKIEVTSEGKKTRTTTPDISNSKYFSKSRDKFKSDKRTYADLVNQYGEGETSKYKVLQKIVESPYATTLEKQLASSFLNYTTKDSKIILGDRTLTSAGVSKGGALGKNSAISSINYEDNSADYDNGNLPVEHVLLHEIGHDLTVYGLSDTNGQFFKELDPLFKFVQETFKNDPDKYTEAGLIKNGEYYAFKNIYEFATEALSNREFQRYLQTIPYKNTQTSTWNAFVNSLKTFFRRLFGTTNETLLNEVVAIITNNIDETYRSVKEKNIALQKEEEALLLAKDEVKKQQSKIELNSGTVSTPNTSAITFAEEDPKKSYKILFTSSTTESETNVDDKEYTPPHISRARRFLNKLKTFKNKEKIKSILLTAKQAEELGIGDIVKDSYKQNRESSIDDIKDVNDASKGWVAQVFVIKERGKVYFIDEQGNKLTTPDVDKIVFQTMPTTSLQWRNNQNRFRAGEEKEAEAASKAWEKYRENLFGMSAKAVMNKVFDFVVSRGIPNEIKINGKKESNNVGGILIDEELIPTQNNLIVIPTTGTISHQEELIKFPDGVPVLQYQDTLQQLNNRPFSKEESKTIFEVLKELSSQIISSTSKGEKINISNNDLVTFLQNVLYWRNVKAEKGNHIFINSETMEIQIGNKTYPISEIANNEKEIIGQLNETYHNVNNKTLSNSLSDTFIQYYFEGNDLKQREWTNYQTYLLASKTSEGKSHSAVLTTSVAKETEQVPSFIAKYSTLDLSEEMEIIIPETKKEAPKEEGKLNDEELTKQANAYIASLITKSVQSEETPTNKTIDVGTFGKVSYEIDAEGNPLIVDDEDYKNTLQTIIKVAKARQSKQTAEPKTEVSEIKLDNTSVNSTPILTFGNVKFKATSADDFTIDWEAAETDKTANAILDKVSSTDTKNTPKDVLLAQTKGLIEQKVKQKIQEVEQQEASTAEEVTPMAPPEVVVQQDIEAKEADIERRRQEALFGNLTPLEFETTDTKGRTRKTTLKTKVDENGFKYSFETTVDGKSSTTSPPKVSKEEFKNSSIYKNLDQNSKDFIDELPDDAIILLQSIAISTDANSAAGLGNGNITIGYVSKSEGGRLDDIILKYQPNKINAKYDAELAALEGDKPSINEEPASEKHNVKNIKGPSQEFRKVGKDVEDRMTDEELELFKEWHATNVPNIPYDVLENIIIDTSGEKNWGVFEDGVAKFVRGGLRGTEYHEIFEGIWKGMLSSTEQQDLLDEFKSKSGTFTDRETGKKIKYSEATDKEAKERIADDFSDYRVGKLPARSLGEKVRRFFKTIMDFFKSFVSKPSLKEELFKAIDTEKFKERTLDERAYDYIPEYRKVGNLTEEETHLYVQDIKARVLGIIFKEGDKTTLFSPERITSDYLFDKVEAMYEEENRLNELGIKAWEELKNKTKESLRSLGISFDIDNKIDINSEERNKNDYAPEPFSLDVKKSSTIAIKALLSSLIERIQNGDREESFDFPKAKLSKVLGFQLVNYSKAFATVLDKLSNTSDKTLAIQKIIELADSDSNYIDLFKKLGGNLSTKSLIFKDFKMVDWRLFIDFFQTFTKQKPEALIQYKDGSDVYVGVANLFSASEQTKRSWIENIKALSQSPEVKIPTKLSGADLLKWAEDNNYSFIYYNTSTRTYQINNQLFDLLPFRTIDDQIKLLNKAGIEFDRKTFNKLNKGQKTDFNDAVSSIKKYFGDNNDLMSISKQTLGINGPLNTLAELYNKVNNPSTDSTYFGVNGERIGSYSENNYSSVFENEFNESETLDELLSKRPELQDVYSQGSQILKKGGMFFDKNGKRIKEINVKYIQGTKEGNKGTTTSKLTLGARFTQEINQNINGDYYIIIPADSTTEWMMSMGNQIDFKSISNNRHLTKVYSIFKQYLLDDVNLALENRNYLKATKNNAKELRFFKDILSEKDLTAINELISKDAPFSKIEEYIENNIESINTSVKELIDNINKKSIDVLKYNREIYEVNNKETNQSEFVYRGLLDTFTKENNLDKFNLSEKELKDVMSFVNINYIINNIEYHKILFGDPYQFEIKKDGSLDELKRIKSFLSPRRTTFDSPELNTFLNQNLNKVNDVQLTKNDYGFQDFKEYVNTITVKDNTILGSLHNIVSVYGNTNETDGFSWMMDGTYREVKIKNRQWDDNQEAWHQWQMAFTRQNIPGYKYSSKELEASDKKLVSKKAPKNKIEVLKPIVTGNKFGENKFNVVLDKLSQMPIYYSMVQGTNLEKLYIQMFKDNVGYAVFESGRKVGAENVHPLYNNDGTLNESPFANKTKISWKSYGIQVETISEDDKSQTRGSQITKLISIDLFDNGNPISEEVQKEYNRNVDLLNRMHQNAYNELLVSFGVTDLGTEYIMKDGKAVSETLLNEMLRRALSDNAIETLKLDENNQFKIPFEASPSYIQIRSILYSAIHKALNSPTMSGGSHVQVPVTGFEKGPRKIAIKTEEGYKNITKKEFDTLSEEQKSKVVITDDTLKFYENKDGERVCEIMVPHWFKSNLGKHSKKTDEELIEFLNTHPEGKQILSGIGFRIPTDALNKIEVFRVKGFLPQYMGATVVVPSEITTKAGSDYDIDKLNMYLKSVYINSNGEIKLVKLVNNNEADTKEFYRKVYENTIQKNIQKLEKYDEFRETLFKIFDLLEGLTLTLTPEQQEFYDVHEDLINEIISQADDEDILPSEYMLNQISKLAQAQYDLSVELINEEVKEKYIKKMYKKALENEYYDSLEKLVTLPENFDRLIAPTDDAGLKDVAKDLDNLKGIDEAGIKNKLINRNFLTNRRNSFLTGKKWVGIVAVNITNLSLKQKSQVYLDVNSFDKLSADDQIFLGDGSILLDHNTTMVNGEIKVSLSGTKTADGSEYISSRLSGYATAVVDVAKDDYITRIINGDLVIGTFMFLENIGAGKQAALFLNQPIIQEYLNMLNSKNSKTLFNKGNIKSIKNKFPVTEEFASGVEIDLSKLDKNIEKYYKDGVTFNIEENAEQQSILNEFLKYAKMAEFNFKFTQATNYDTTKFGNSEELFRKQLKTNNAKNNNIFSSVDNILNNTFIGVQSELLDKSMDAMAPILKLENTALRYITNKVLEAYAANDYLSGEKFNKIALGIKTSFLDYIIQTKSGINNLIKELLIDPDTNVSGQLALLKEKYPDIAILKELESVSSDRVEGAKSVKLKANIKEAYDENLYTGMMRELRDYNDETNKLYKDLVLLSVLQGSYQSAISIKNIIPLEDYADIVSKYVDNIQDVESLNAFGLGMFQRNNFKNDEIVPDFIPNFLMTKSEQERQYASVNDSDVFTYYSRMFPSIETMNIKPNDRKVLLLSEKWDSFNLKNDFLKVKRVFSPRNSGDLIDFTTGKTITKKEIYLRKQKGDLSLQDVFGYKKVYLPISDEQGNRIPLTHTNKNGDVFHVYKLVNLYGDGQYASEHYTTPIKSVINNGTAKIDNEIPDDHLIEYYSANQPIFEEIEEEFPIVKPESSVNKKSIFELRNNPITYTKGQEKALTEIAQIIDANKQGYYLLAGYAGTGKTTLAENIAKYAQESGKEVKIIAPTNKAAKVLNDKLKSTGVRAEASTIHKTIYGEPDSITGEWVLSAKLKNSVIIIDESSMIEKDVMQDLIDSSKGNNILIFMGDSFQLEQIGKDSGLFKELLTPNTFSKNYGVNINGATQLTEVKRQSLDSNILKLATLQRNENKAYVPTESIEGFKVDHSKQDFINDFKDSVKNNEDSVMIVATNAERITMNNVARFAKYGKEKEVLEEGDKLISVANSANYSNSEIFDVKQLRGEPTIFELTFDIKGKISKQDCYVYYIVNDKGQEIKTLLFPTLDMPSLYHSQILEAMKESNRDMYDAFNNDSDIITTQKGKQKLSPAISIATYGYAITAHKSQGSQWDTVFVNQNYKADTWNGARWFYTAITRAAQQVVVMPTANNTRISPEEINKKIDAIATETTPIVTEQASLTDGPKGVKVKDGIYVNQEALTKEEQLELFDYLKPFLEEQGAKTNKSPGASKMIGLGLRWDYKSNNPGKQAMDIPDAISTANKTKYGYYDSSINNQPLAPITPRFRELMQKATGVDMTNYDGAIINLYDATSFISAHNDVDESKSAIGYPVIGINLGGTGNFSIESRDGDPKQLDLKAGSAYIFGVDGVNRAVYHRTFDKPQDSFLPELTTKIDGKTYEPGSYRVTVTMRRVMPLEPGMPSKPTIGNQTPVAKTTPATQDSKPQIENIIKELGNKTQSKHVVLPGQDELEDVKYDGNNFWNEIVPEARSWFENQAHPILIAFRGNKNKTFVQNYKEGNTIGNPFDWQKYGEEIALKMFVDWMVTGNNAGETNATEAYRQALINDFKSGKWKGSTILYYKELNRPSHATAIDYFANKYNWNSEKSPEPTQDRQIQVEQFKITIKPDGKMFYDNGKELTDQTTINKVNVRKELQDGTLRTSIYNKANYFVLLDGRIVGSGKTNLGKESITDPKIKEAILAKAVTYKKEC